MKSLSFAAVKSEVYSLKVKETPLRRKRGLIGPYKLEQAITSPFFLALGDQITRTTTGLNSSDLASFEVFVLDLSFNFLQGISRECPQELPCHV